METKIFLRCLRGAALNTVKWSLKLNAHTNKYTNEMREEKLIWTLVSACIPPESVSVVGFKMQVSKLLCRCHRTKRISLCNTGFINTVCCS